MSRKIADEKVEALRKYSEEKVPDLVIIYKDEPLPDVWWLKLLFWLVAVVGFFSPAWETKWMSRVSNAIGTRYMVFPTREGYGDLSDWRTYTVYRHELVHLQDVRKYGIWFLLTYAILPLPVLLAGRAHWEYRAYAQNMLVRYEEFGEIPDSTLDWIGEHYWGTLYFWMWPFKKYVRKKLERLRQDIYDGKVQGYHPEVTWWKGDSSI